MYMEKTIEDKNYCVYVHTSPSGKKYVGQTCRDPEKRWGKNGIHYLQKKKNKYQHPAFANAILKYGWENFEHEVIASNLTKEEADNFEKLLIKELNTMDFKYGYNCMSGGSNGTPSEETRKRQSEAQKGEKSHRYGKHLTEEMKKRLSEAHKGKVFSEDTRKNMSKAKSGENHPLYGTHRSEETKRKIRDGQKKHKVIQYSLQVELIKVWDCMTDAGKELGIDISNILKCCKGKRPHAGGFIWRDYEDIKEEVI